MAKKKIQYLWLSKNAYLVAAIRLSKTQPRPCVGDEDYLWSNRGGVIEGYCYKIWNSILPGLKLKSGTCRKIKLTTLANGMKMEWADKKILKLEKKK